MFFIRGLFFKLEILRSQNSVSQKKRKCTIYLFTVFLALSISARALVTHAQTINTISSIDFGDFDFATTYNGTIQLGTNDTLNTTGSGISYNGGATRGQIRVTAPGTGIIDVKCATTAQMVSPPSADPFDIDQIELAVTTGVAFGSGNSCNGLGGGDAVATTVDLDANPNPDIYIGARINIPTPITLPASHSYTTTGTGTPVMLSIVVQ